MQGAEHERFSDALADEIGAHGDGTQEASAVDVVGAEARDPLATT